MEQDKRSKELLAEIGKLNEEIKKIREDIDQSYYRIPKKEFESITIKNIAQEVTEQMVKKFNFWRNILGIVIIALSFLGISQWGEFKGKLLGDIEKTSKEIQKNIDRFQNDIRKDHEILAINLRSEIGYIDPKIEKKINERISDFMNSQKEDLEKLEKKLSDATKEITDRTEKAKESLRQSEIIIVRQSVSSIANNISNKLKQSEISVLESMSIYQEGINNLDPLLPKAKDLKDKALVEDILDHLFRWKFLSNVWEELDKLRETHEKDYEFRAESWANIAIADMFLYEENNSSIYKKRAIDAYRKALEKLPDYGLPHAVRLIIHIIDYERQSDQKIKEEEKNNAKKLLESITIGSRFLTSYEAYDYLNRNRMDPLLGKYIDIIFGNFPELMDRLRERYEKYTG